MEVMNQIFGLNKIKTEDFFEEKCVAKERDKIIRISIRFFTLIGRRIEND